MEPEKLLAFLEKLDKLTAAIINPALNRYEHMEIAQGLKAVHEYIKEAEENKKSKKESSKD